MIKRQATETLVIAAAAAWMSALLAVAVFAEGAGWKFFGPLSRVVTPNGDGVNDVAIFCFDNPAQSDVSGKIYTMLGSEVATLGPAAQNAAQSQCPAGAFANSGENLNWDGRSEGAYVRGGLYVYRITSEQRSYSGTLIVVR